MSGGSHNYLCYRDAQNLIEESNFIYELDLMCADIKEYHKYSPHAPNAIALTRIIQGKLHQIQKDLKEINEIIDKVSPVWKAVEWHHSGDSSYETVLKALSEMEQ